MKGLIRSRKRTVHHELLIAVLQGLSELEQRELLTTTHDGGCAQAARSPCGGLKVLPRYRIDFSTTIKMV